MSDRASQVLDFMMHAPVFTVEPDGFTVVARTSYGVHGEGEEAALTMEWLDADGCQWIADFSENALALAEVRDGTVSLRDSDGVNFVFRPYEPVKQISLSSHGGRG